MSMGDQALLYEQHQKTKTLSKASREVKTQLEQLAEMVFTNYQMLDDIRERLEDIEESLPSLLE